MQIIIFKGLLQESLRTDSKEFLNVLVIANHLCDKVMQRQLGKIESASSFCVDKKFGSLTMCILSAYADFFDGSTDEAQQQIIDLRLDLISTARKDCNNRMCLRELRKCYQHIEKGEQLGLPLEGGIDGVKKFLMRTENIYDHRLWGENMCT